ncbi:TonB-dependent receptor plug domain protein [Capnocytophaga canimorsus]|uniref:TonB-dependent receptor plug domain protein n=1 Tax=Capnocytophaga canimorsus TaxID=28188 RepID=A0A0B7HH58_9FLAO|nr:SusC/RagA family TonB-linked outer membrane protein [Capnocytophaga canimorsus]ATA77963.1 SusC/RagA family TonB-linked outer membrane protein [Capnocytophaga canimorsus]PJI80263.1 TonB-linked SusC/RagA family outer membrane protein [Capnocytophaga canimorsus]CEN36883.1 TonB-dependent receptor plug domain protein [Capnocytophaga canimorsus]STA73270.1 Outer membrane cobalamin receptor protein [Capnocytophaga canimorsus]
MIDLLSRSNSKGKLGKFLLIALACGLWADAVYAKAEITSVREVVEQQTKKVSGTVTDESGQPLPGVSVFIKGTQRGITTDFDGNYQIQASQGEMLVFSYVGFVTQEKIVSSTGNELVINISLKEETQQLEQVVVTALGIKRQEKALSYNVQQVKSEELTRVKDANFVNSLNGKVAGVNIQKSSSGVGGQTKVVMRGAKSILGGNNVLYVIDGVPMGENTNRERGDQKFGTPASSEGIADFNSEDIESISVLTGPSAAALYGAAAANGVILINTKKGKEGKMKVNLSSSVEFSNPLILPEFQNTYGTSDLFFSWGDKLDTPSSLDPKKFFNVGTTYNNALNFSVGNKQNQTFVSAASITSEGIVSNNQYRRHNVLIRNTSSFLDDKLELDVSASYVRQFEKNMISFGEYFNPIVGVYLFPRGENFDWMKSFELYDMEKGYNAIQNRIPGDLGKDIQNPYWIMYRNVRPKVRDRYMFSGQLKYNIFKNLNIAGRVRLDNTYSKSEDKRYAGTLGAFAKEKGRYAYSQGTFKQKYADLIMNYNTSFADDFNLVVNAGTSFEDYDNKGKSYRGEIKHIANKFFISNTDASTAVVSDEGGNDRRRNIAVFASAELGWKSALYLTLTGRNDWASQLVNSDEESIFYPSVGVSAVITELLSPETKNKLYPYLGFAKIRASFTEVGSPISVTGITPGTITKKIEGGSIKANDFYPLTAPLKAERTRSFEVGISTKWLKNRLSLDVTAYKSNTYNQLLLAGLPKSSGYQTMYVQAGNVENKGLEVALGYNQEVADFNFGTSLTATANQNKIIRLASGIPNPFDASSPIDIKEMTVGNFYLREGGSIGDIYANNWIKRDKYGLVDISSGTIATEATEPYMLGSVNPDWLLGWQGNLGYKNLSLNFLFKARLGGVVVSKTQQILDYYGVSKASADARDLGYAQLGSFKVNPRAYYNAINALDAYYTYSATNVRLQEVSLTYSFPKQALGKTFSDLSISLIGNNLWMIYNKAPFDPELTSTTGTFGQGYDYFMLPSLRSYGLSVKIGF